MSERLFPSSALVVYLDQNQWVNLARARFVREHKSMTPTLLDAADYLLAAAREGHIALPLSTAHASETARARGERRQHLARTMLDAYGGWHMAHPLRVRRQEMLRSMRGVPAALDRRSVFNRDPRTPYEEPDDQSDPALPRDIREVVDEIDARLDWAELLRNATFDREEHDLAITKAAGWGATNAALADYLVANPAQRDMKIVAMTRALADLGEEPARLAHANGVDLPAFTRWLNEETVVQTFLDMPFLGRIVALLDVRLRNPQKRWTANDLLDTWFGVCAAAYADVVVTESFLGDVLNRGRSVVTPGATVVTNLVDARQVVESRLAQR